VAHGTSDTPEPTERLSDDQSIEPA